MVDQSNLKPAQSGAKSQGARMLAAAQGKGPAKGTFGGTPAYRPPINQSQVPFPTLVVPSPADHLPARGGSEEGEEGGGKQHVLGVTTGKRNGGPMLGGSEPKRQAQVTSLFSAHNKKVQQQRLAPAGMVNLGNTCYLNAVVQVLLAMPSFVEDLRSPALERLRAQMPTGGVWAALLTTANKLRTAGTARPTFDMLKPAVEPCELRGAMGRRSARWRGFGQQDAHEFLVELLEALQSEVLGAEGVASGARRIKQSATRCPSARNLGGCLMHTWTCSACGRCTRARELFSCLSLQLPPSGEIKLEDLVSEYLRDETLDKNCDGCSPSAPVSHTAQHHLWRLPRVLVIHIKRFMPLPQATPQPTPQHIIHLLDDATTSRPPTPPPGSGGAAGDVAGPAPAAPSAAADSPAEPYLYAKVHTAVVVSRTLDLGPHVDAAARADANLLQGVPPAARVDDGPAEGAGQEGPEAGPSTAAAAAAAPAGAATPAAVTAAAQTLDTLGGGSTCPSPSFLAPDNCHQERTVQKAGPPLSALAFLTGSAARARSRLGKVGAAGDGDAGADADDEGQGAGARLPGGGAGGVVALGGAGRTPAATPLLDTKAGGLGLVGNDLASALKRPGQGQGAAAGAHGPTPARGKGSGNHSPTNSTDGNFTGTMARGCGGEVSASGRRLPRPLGAGQFFGGEGADEADHGMYGLDGPPAKRARVPDSTPPPQKQQQPLAGTAPRPRPSSAGHKKPVEEMSYEEQFALALALSREDAGVEHQFQDHVNHGPAEAGRAGGGGGAGGPVLDLSGHDAAPAGRSSAGCAGGAAAGKARPAPQPAHSGSRGERTPMEGVEGEDGKLPLASSTEGSELDEGEGGGEWGTFKPTPAEPPPVKALSKRRKEHRRKRIVARRGGSNLGGRGSPLPGGDEGSGAESPAAAGHTGSSGGRSQLLAAVVAGRTRTNHSAGTGRGGGSSPTEISSDHDATPERSLDGAGPAAATITAAAPAAAAAVGGGEDEELERAMAESLRFYELEQLQRQGQGPGQDQGPAAAAAEPKPSARDPHSEPHACRLRDGTDGTVGILGKLQVQARAAREPAPTDSEEDELQAVRRAEEADVNEFKRILLETPDAPHYVASTRAQAGGAALEGSAERGAGQELPARPTTPTGAGASGLRPNGEAPPLAHKPAASKAAAFKLDRGAGGSGAGAGAGAGFKFGFAAGPDAEEQQTQQLVQMLDLTGDGGNDEDDPDLNTAILLSLQDAGPPHRDVAGVGAAAGVIDATCEDVDTEPGPPPPQRPKVVLVADSDGEEGGEENGDGTASAAEPAAHAPGLAAGSCPGSEPQPGSEPGIDQGPATGAGAKGCGRNGSSGSGDGEGATGTEAAAAKAGGVPLRGPLARYRLQGVVRHKGKTPFQGHYVADVLTGPPNGPQSWYELNDSVASQVDFSRVREDAKGQGYMLFYVNEARCKAAAMAAAASAAAAQGRGGAGGSGATPGARPAHRVLAEAAPSNGRGA